MPKRSKKLQLPHLPGIWFVPAIYCSWYSIVTQTRSVPQRDLAVRRWQASSWLVVLRCVEVTVFAGVFMLHLDLPTATSRFSIMPSLWLCKSTFPPSTRKRSTSAACNFQRLKVPSAGAASAAPLLCTKVKGGGAASTNAEFEHCRTWSMRSLQYHKVRSRIYGELIYCVYTSNKVWSVLITVWFINMFVSHVMLRCNSIMRFQQPDMAFIQGSSFSKGKLGQIRWRQDWT